MGQMLMGSAFMAVPGIVLGRAGPAAPAVAWVVVVALALLRTVGAYLLYYALIARVGPTRTSSTTYLLPVFASIYGAVFLHERLSLWVLVGFALILFGVGVVNGRLRSMRPAEHATAAEGLRLGACD